MGLKGAWGATKLAGKTALGAVTLDGERIKKAFSDAGDGIADTVNNIERSAGKLGNRIGGGLADGAKAVGRGIGNAVVGTANYVGRGVEDAAKTVVRGGAQTASGISDTLKKAKDNTVANFKSEKQSLDAEKAEKQKKLDRAHKFYGKWKKNSERNLRHKKEAEAAAKAAEVEKLKRGKRIGSAWKKDSDARKKAIKQIGREIENGSKNAIAVPNKPKPIVRRSDEMK